MAFDPSAYRIAVQRQNIDGDMYHVGTVLELPDVIVYEESYDAAYSALIAIITDLKVYKLKRKTSASINLYQPLLLSVLGKEAHQNSSFRH
jgi:hypothetical protein